MVERKKFIKDKAKFVLAIIVGFITVDLYFNYKIDDKINDSNFIESIASSVRPAILFDLETETVIYDLGGMKFIKDIKVEKNDKIKTIVLTPNNFMQNAPILTAIDMFGYKVDVRRGKYTNWEYEILVSSHLGGNDLTRFRIEIISKK